jgi:hypothetical protein
LAAGNYLTILNVAFAARELLFPAASVAVSDARYEPAFSARRLRGFDTDGEPYFDRLDEQLNRLVGAIDAAANGLGMLLDLQLN